MPLNIAVLGATGAVGLEFLSILHERNIPVSNLRLLASPRSAGTRLPFRDRQLAVEEVSPRSFEDIDIAFFSAGASISRQWASIANAAGARVIDNSSAFRMDPDVPLVVPEINPETICDARIIANPNCSTIIMALAIWPLHRENPLRRVVVSTYQAASGAGLQAMRELEQQSRDLLDGKPAVPRVLPHQVAFNLFSHNSAMQPSGYNQEEIKMIEETRKIFAAPDLPITATCVRVPVPRAHSESINLAFERPMPESLARDILRSAPGLSLIDDRASNRFPMPVDASGKDDVYVGRIRQDLSQPDSRGIDLFACGDQLRKGAALNAVQIAESLEIA